MQIGVASSSSVGIPVLRALLASHHDVNFVLTNPEKKTGRGKNLSANDFHTYAKDQGVEILTPSNSSEIFSVLQERKTDLILTIAYGHLVNSASLSIPKFGWLNIHFSQLPRWRGASPVQSAILAGDTETGISIFKLEEGMDTGPIYLRLREPILDTEKTSTILNRLSHIASEQVSSLLDQISNGLSPAPQEQSGVTYAKKFTKSDGRLNPRGSRDDFLRKIRALGENPGTSLIFRGEVLKIDEATMADGQVESWPLSSVKVTKSALFLMLNDGPVELVRVIPAGKKSMSGADFARGARIENGEVVE